MELYFQVLSYYPKELEISLLGSKVGYVSCALYSQLWGCLEALPQSKLIALIALGGSLGDTSHLKRSRHKNLTSFFYYNLFKEKYIIFSLVLYKTTLQS